MVHLVLYLYDYKTKYIIESIVHKCTAQTNPSTQDPSPRLIIPNHVRNFFVPPFIDQTKRFHHHGED